MDTKNMYPAVMWLLPYISIDNILPSYLLK